MAAARLKYLWQMLALGVLVIIWQIATLTNRRPRSARNSLSELERRGGRGGVPALLDGGGGGGGGGADNRVVPSLAQAGRAEVDGQPTIFVNIAAFRDYEANATLHWLYERAEYPQRVFVGLICQMDYGHPEEQCIYPDMWEEQCGTQAWCPSDNILSRTFDAKHARGPTYARHLASLLYRGEAYFMMIDSHNRFVRHWDTRIVDEHRKIGRSKAVLSTYPMAINQQHPEKEEGGVAYLCSLGTAGNGWTAGFPGPYWANTYHPSDYPKPQPYIGAGLVFGPGSMVIDVPFDKHLPYLFFGEEFMVGIRLWTSGYDLYSPGCNIIYHHYGRTGPRMETHGAKVSQMQHLAHKRIQHILGVTKHGTKGRERIVPLDTTDAALTADLPKYGLGTKRSLWQYWKFARLDPVVMNKQTFQDHWCTTYGPKRGPYDDKWREFTKEDDLPASVWWKDGVAKLSVPFNHSL